MLVKAIFSFLLGGSICAAAQILIDKTKLTPAKILVLFVVLGVVLYAVGIFDPLFEACGCGITLPLIGFGANVGRGVREAIDQDGISGILSGPVRAMAEGVSAALLSGFILSLIFRGRSKKL